MLKLVVLTGSGISRESGIKTFRETGGLWETYNVTEVASPEGWAKDMELVLSFYNERRKQLKDAKPNQGHSGLVDLANYFDVHIITQNIDNLHERAGSRNVLHLHGLLTQARSTGYPELIYDIGYNDIKPGDKCEKGHQLRPHIVWFGEAVSTIEEAAFISSTADIFAVVGTSLIVYPAAGLINYTPQGCPIYVIDPNEIMAPVYRKVEFIKEKASKGVEMLKHKLIKEYI
jgi:NAD-dependent deacetylase